MTDPFGTQINNSNIYTQVWNTFYNLIKNNIDDPKERSETWIYGSMPKTVIEYENNDGDTEIQPSYPMIIINNVELSNQENHTLDYDTKEYIPQINIDIYSDRSDYLDSITDNIVELISDNNSSFTDIGIYNIKIINDNVNYDLSRSGLKIFNRTLSFVYEVI